MATETVVSGLLCAALVWLAPGSALAKSRLLYSREGNAVRCPDEQALREAVHARLGYDAFSPWGERAVVAEIFEEGGKLRARLRLLDEQGVVVGTREVRAASDDCEELVRSLSLSISITLDPLAPSARVTTEEPAAEPSAAPLVEAAPVAPETAKAREETPVPPVRPARDEVRRMRAARSVRSSTETHASLRVGPVLHAGFGPGSAPLGARLAVALERGAARLVLDTTATLPMGVDSDFGGRANVQVTTASLAPCLGYRFVAGCGLFVAGRTSSWATDAPNTRSDSALYVAVGARVEVRAPIARSFDVLLAADGLRNLSPVSVYLHGEKLWQSPALAGSLAIAAAFTFL